MDNGPRDNIYTCPRQPHPSTAALHVLAIRVNREIIILLKHVHLKHVHTKENITLHNTHPYQPLSAYTACSPLSQPTN